MSGWLMITVLLSCWCGKVRWIFSTLEKNPVCLTGILQSIQQKLNQVIPLQHLVTSLEINRWPVSYGILHSKAYQTMSVMLWRLLTHYWASHCMVLNLPLYFSGLMLTKYIAVELRRSTKSKSYLVIGKACYTLTQTCHASAVTTNNCASLLYNHPWG